jgi:hypothetical protein
LANYGTIIQDRSKPMKALADAAKAHGDMESRKTTGKLVLVP